MAPKDIKNIKAAKIATVRSVAEAPVHSWPEFAFVGRSNVGKSSLLTMLTGLHNLAPVSKTPGRTKTLGFYALKDPEICLVDLPGYGWAQLGQDLRQLISVMISDYIYQRDNLLGLILLIDSRRGEPSAEDRQMVELALSANRALLVVLTKCDKLSKSQLGAAKAKVEKELGLPRNSTIAVSSETGLGKKELWGQISQLLRMAKENSALSPATSETTADALS